MNEICECMNCISPQNPPQVYAHLTSGGMIEATITRGHVDLIVVDWDEYKRGLEHYELEDLVATRKELTTIADPEIRKAALSNINETINEWIELFGETR